MTSDDLSSPEDEARPQDEDERLEEDVVEPPEEADRDRDDEPGPSGPEHLGLTPPD